jgi:hypothetical protein
MVMEQLVCMFTILALSILNNGYERGYAPVKSSDNEYKLV